MELSVKSRRLHIAKVLLYFIISYENGMFDSYLSFKRCCERERLYEASVVLPETFSKKTLNLSTRGERFG